MSKILDDKTEKEHFRSLHQPLGVIMKKVTVEIMFPILFRDPWPP